MNDLRLKAKRAKAVQNPLTIKHDPSTKSKDRATKGAPFFARFGANAKFGRPTRSNSRPTQVRRKRVQRVEKSKRQNFQNLLDMGHTYTEQQRGVLEVLRGASSTAENAVHTPLLWDRITAELTYSEVSPEFLDNLFKSMKDEEEERAELENVDFGGSVKKGLAVSFSFCGLFVEVGSKKTTINNSLHKACRGGENLSPYYAEELEALFAKLEALTCLPIRRARVQYLEIGFNSFAPRPTSADVEAMRSNAPNGCKVLIIYNDNEGETAEYIPSAPARKGRQFAVYNKTTEIRDKMKKDIQKEVTRIEARRTERHLKELQGGKPFLTLGDLTAPETIAKGYALLAEEARALDQGNAITPAHRRAALLATLGSRSPDFKGLILEMGEAAARRAVEAHKYPNRNQKRNKLKQFEKQLAGLRAYAEPRQQAREDEILRAGFFLLGFMPQA